MRLASISLVLFGLVVACSGEAASTDPTTSNGATDPATASTVTSTCEKVRARASRCEADPAMAKDKGDKDCEHVGVCHHGRSIRDEVRAELDACAFTRECRTGIDSCRDAVAQRHASDEGVAEFAAACSRRRSECNEPQNTYFDSHDCAEFALVSDRAAFARCLSEPCKAVGGCFVAVLGACE